MLFYETALWGAATLTTALSYLVFMLVDLVRRSTVQGTRRRFLAATIQRAFAYLGLGYPCLMVIEDATRANYFGLVVDAFLVYFWYETYRKLIDADDDHWFRHLRQRLRRWVTSLAPTPLPTST